MTADPSSSSTSHPRFWRNALLLLGSAAFGGLAVALWNRRELAQIQSRKNELTFRESPPSTEEEEEEDVY